MDEEVRRVTTTRKPKKITSILLAVVAVLGIGLIGIAIYFYTIGDSSNEENRADNNCACYYIDPAVVSECADPRRGFLFEISTSPNGETCKTTCSTSKLTENLLKSNTQQDLYQICQLQTVQDIRCNSMVIKDKDGKIITGKIESSEEITIEAIFDQEYTEYQFLINNEPSDPDLISPDKLTIKKTLSSVTGTSLNIVATAKDSSSEQINSPICRRLIEIDTEGTSNVNDFQILTRIDNKTFKISSLKIGVGNITDQSKLNILFSFGEKFADLTMTKGFTLDTAKGQISILEQDLYSAANFSNNASFAQLNNHEGKLTIKANLKVDNASIGEISRDITYPDKETLEGENEEPVTPTASNFTVSKTSNVTCVERVAPNNIAQFTLTATNSGTTTQTISSVKDKLPLGFTYVDQSTKINGVSVTDNEYLTKSTVGNTQELVWAKTSGWTMSAGQSLTVIFQALVGADALTGQNQNEVIITPTEIPEDPATLRAEYVILVQQDCENPTEEPVTPEVPDTGLFDSTVGKLILGLFIVIVGWFIYTKPLGRVIISRLINTAVYKEAEMTSWRMFKPKKYFEEKIVRQTSKK